MNRLVFAVAATLYIPPPAGPLAQEPLVAAVRVFYGPSEGFDTIDAHLIAGAKKSIDMAAYVLTDRAVVAALGAAAMRGVRVRVYIDGEESGRARSAADAIAVTPNVQIRRKGRSRDLMHLKSYSVDGRVLRSGSANFSVSGAEYQDNDLILIESRAAVAQFSSTFERLWARADNQKIGSR